MNGANFLPEGEEEDIILPDASFSGDETVFDFEGDEAVLFDAEFDFDFDEEEEDI